MTSNQTTAAVSRERAQEILNQLLWDWHLVHPRDPNDPSKTLEPPKGQNSTPEEAKELKSLWDKHPEYPTYGDLLRAIVDGKINQPTSPFNQGYQAGVELSGSCPYNQETEPAKYTDWVRGWNRGLQERFDRRDQTLNDDEPF